MRLPVVCCVTLVALSLYAQERLVFEAGGARGWAMFPAIKSDSIVCDPSGKNLVLAKGKTSSTGWIWVAPATFNPSDDYRIEAKIRQINGDIFNGFGVVYGYTDARNYAAFMMSSWNQVKFASVEDGRWTDWRDMLQLKCTKPMGEWNVLVLEKIGSTATIKVNDTTVIVTQAPKVMGSAIGFVAHAIMTLEVEYLRLIQAPAGKLQATPSAPISSALPNATMRFHNILFDLGMAEVRRTSLGELNQVVGFLRSNQDMLVEIGGHTDNIGSRASNLKLSEERAEAVMKYLVTKGIAATRITAKGYGESQPIASNKSDEGRQQNRRVEFVMRRK